MPVLCEKAVVVRVDEGEAILRVDPSDEARCGSCTACGSGGAKGELRVRDSEDLRVGDVVTIEVAVPSVVLSALLVFVAPFVYAAVGYLAAALISDVTWVRVVGAVIGFGGAFLAAALYDRRWRAKNADGVTIVNVERAG